MLGTVSIYANADLVRLGDFNFHQSIVTNVQRVTNATSKSKIAFEWESGLVTITAKSVAKGNVLSMEVKDDHDWKKVETFVERWMQAKKQDINVKYTVTYQKQRSTNTMDSDDDEDNMFTGRKVNERSIGLANCRPRQ
jgi:nickel-dependent lactate racemase